MTTHMTEAVVAGSRGFALALLAPLTERIGTRPRIAADPAQALAFFGGPGGIVVVEFLGADTLRVIKDLVLQGDRVRIVAALADAHAAAEGPLRALGVDFARWDGNPDAVLGAVTRQLAAAAMGRGRIAPALEVKRAAIAQAPASPPAAMAPAAPLPPPAAVVTAASSAPARSAPALAPPPRSSTPAVLAAPPRIARAPAAPPPIAAAPPAPATPGASSVAALFEDLHHEGRHQPDDGAGARSRAAAEPAMPWPANVPGREESGVALALALSGEALPPGSPLAAAAAVVASLSDIERAAISGSPLPLDAGPIRRAAVMRVRVAAALATAPAPGGEVDAAEVSAFLVEIDGLLEEVNALAAGATAEMQASLEAVRHALVKEAIDFSEAAQPALADGEQAPASAAAARTARTRLLSQSPKAREERTPDKRRAFMIAALVVSTIGAGAFHGYRYLLRSRAYDDAPTRIGAPASSVVVAAPSPSAAAVVRSKDGRPFTPEELKRLSDSEALKGNSVILMAPGLVMIVPAGQRGPPPAELTEAR